jgi:hypothetical protein
MGQRRRKKTISGAELHRSWIELVDTEGPFLAIAPLRRIWPNGMPQLSEEAKVTLHDARKPFEAAWETWNRGGEVETFIVARDRWVEMVLRDIIGWADALDWSVPTGISASSANHLVSVTPRASLVGSDGLGALVYVVDPMESIRVTLTDGWAATPIDRMEALLRASGIPVGIVTDGRWWGVVWAEEGKMAASGIVDALSWVEEPRTRDAFFAICARGQIIGGDPSNRLPVLFNESIAAAEEITEALGAQVRSAVELLIQAFSEAAADSRRRGLPNPLTNNTHEIYQAAVTILMRTVFLLFAEERGMLPTGELFEQGYGISSELDSLLAREAEEGEEALDSTQYTWHRLLSTSRALFEGASFEDVRMPKYGGSLFDPDRFAFLTAVEERGTLAVTVSDRVMRHVLGAVQFATIKGDARRISFRDIDVEQIGYIYEGLLGYTARIVEEPYVGVLGRMGVEPEVPLAKLEELRTEHPIDSEFAAALRAWIESDQPNAEASSVAAISKAIKAVIDPSVVSALSQAVGDDSGLRERVRPWLGLIRLDLRKRPFVALPGGLLVRETPSRKNAGAHYTPKSLAEEVVVHALQPLCYAPGPFETNDESQWKLRKSDEILGLKVADIACGSGAFLVAAARYLADRVVEAWTVEGTVGAARDPHLAAIREVVANCLYGADINDMAIEMCKLSLWLVSLDRDLPFSFVDDKVFLGNSLLGVTNLDQIRRRHIDPSKTPQDSSRLEIFDFDVDGIIRKAVHLRDELSAPIDDSDPARSGAAKHRLLEEFKSTVSELRTIADGVIAAGLALGGKPGKPLDQAYENLSDAISRGLGDLDVLEKIIANGLIPTVETDYEQWQPLHWVIEAPDVIVDHGGFDAIIGNPPFLGGQKLTGAMGTNVRDWLVNVVAEGRRGSADLVAYFFLRAKALMKESGTLGLIATNTVAQGDTREVGLDAMVSGGFTITRAIQSRSWPAASANLEFAAVWGSRREISSDVLRIADDIPVRQISTLLEPAGRVEGLPSRLAENLGISFQGCIVLGGGFVLTPDEAHSWIASEVNNSKVLFPYLNGQDLNSRPDGSASRWVIDFSNLPMSFAAEYELPFQRVSEMVKPERQRLNPDGSFVLGKPLTEKWWQYCASRPAMRRAISTFAEVLVITLVSKTVMPFRVPTDQIFSHALGVFATDDFGDQAVLSSTPHQLWAITYGSAMRNDPRYTPTDVFETFPRPATSDELREIGRRLEEERRAIMLRRNLGLTKLYNLVNDPAVSDAEDPDVASLREIHRELDEIVLDAYGWSDIVAEHGFFEFRKMRKWTVSPSVRIEILDRLLELNHERARLASPVIADPIGDDEEIE